MKASNEIAELLNGDEWLASVHNKVASTTSESISAAAIAIVAREVIAALQAEPVNVTDDMALAFHRALTDGGLPADDLEEIKTGLRAALANAAQPAKVPEARIIWALLTSLKDWKHAMEYTDLVTADMLLERIEWEIEQLTAAPTAGEGEESCASMIFQKMPRSPFLVSAAAK